MENNKSYKQILKSTTIVGGAQISNILIGVFRTKVIALLLGPSGIGIMGILQNLIEMIRSASGFGINFSAVKSIAEATGTNDVRKISYMVVVLRRWAIATGILGAVIAIALSIPLSIYSFGDKSYAWSIVCLSVVLLITAVSSAQGALLQGMRKIPQMAKSLLIGSVIGTAVTLPLYFWLGNDGIVPGLIIVSIISLLISWLYTRNIKIEKVDISLKETFFAGLGMAKLGFFIVINGFVATVSLYIIRAFIMNRGGFETVGFFNVVWTISTLYIGTLLNSMLADFFPRLSMVHHDVIESNKLMNEQLKVVLLIGTPMFSAMIIFAPIAVHLLYSTSFNAAVPVLQWHMLSSFFMLISWALGVLFLSKNKGEFSIIGETLKQLVFLALIYWGWDRCGFEILGIGWLIAISVNMLFVVYIVRLWHFQFTWDNIKYILGFAAVIIFIFVNVRFYTSFTSQVLRYAFFVLLCAYCFFELNKILKIKDLLKNKFKKNDL